jgi:hypothetical protein
MDGRIKVVSKASCIMSTKPYVFAEFMRPHRTVCEDMLGREGFLGCSDIATILRAINLIMTQHLTIDLIEIFNSFETSIDCEGETVEGKPGFIKT